jgi:adenylylsulfate kinase-like enzyme
VTGTYKKAAAALDQHGFVLLIGEPAAGKTTIASLLAMAALDQWNASTLKLDEPVKGGGSLEPGGTFAVFLGG